MSVTPWSAASIQPVEPGGQGRPADAEIGPGIIGFLVTFGVAVALVFLVRDMNRRIQRLRYGRAGDPPPPPGDPGRGPGPPTGPAVPGNPG